MARLLDRIEGPLDLKRLKPEDLPRLCQEIREEIIGTCSRNGGHLGSSLGAVELVVALHYVYNSPLDRLVFDVGHQAYAHKLLTGRRDRFRTIRTEGGLAGFPERHESEHDAFGVGHASTAISAALGMIEARRHHNEAGKVVALVGDGALTGGMGFQYVGPVDGHDVLGLVETFGKVQACGGPVLVHAITTKGKGYQPAEKDLATRGHGLSFFDIATGKSVAKKPAVKSFTDLFADALCEQMERDPRVVAITAAMLEGTGLIKAQQRFPDRTYDVTFAAGLACEGLRPVVAIYSTFLQRAYDQIIHDVAVQRLPVTFALDRGGLVGADGKTHQGAFDLTYLRCVPNMLLMAPSDENEMRHMLATALAYDGPAAFRFPRASGLGVALDASPAPFELGKARLARNGGPRPDLLVLAAGTVVQAALAAGEALAQDGYAVSVVDARFVKPLDEELFCSLAVAARCVLTVEEASLVGGFGAGCLEAFERHGVLHQLRVRRLGLPDSFITHGDAAKQRVQLGLDAAGIAAVGRELVGDRAARGVA